MQESLLSFRVRYAECDAMRYAHHSSYLLWFEQGRIEWLRERGISYRELEANQIFLPVTHLELRYRRPGHFDDLLQLRTRLSEAGYARVVFAYRLHRQEPNGTSTLLTEAQSELASVDANGKLVRFPDTLRAVLSMAE